MRRPWPKGLAALGLALLPAAALAGDTAPCAACANGGSAPMPAQVAPGATRIKVGHLCDACAAKLRKQGGPATMMAGDMHGTMACTTCGNAPGYAAVGGGSAPGYALVGAAMPGAEPAPVGVVQTTYRSQAGMPQRGPVLNTPTTPPPSIMSPEPSRRPHVLSHMFFLSGRSLGDEWYMFRMSHRKSKHASIAYGGEAQNKVNELPMSVVYRQR
jgi:hypothetical protein